MSPSDWALKRKQEALLALQTEQRNKAYHDRCFLACDEPRADHPSTVKVGDFVQNVGPRESRLWGLGFVSKLGYTVDRHGRRYPTGARRVFRTATAQMLPNACC